MRSFPLDIFSCCTKDGVNVASEQAYAAPEPRCTRLGSVRPDSALHDLIAECENGWAVVPSPPLRARLSSREQLGLSEDDARAFADFIRAISCSVDSAVRKNGLLSSAVEESIPSQLNRTSASRRREGQGTRTSSSEISDDHGASNSWSPLPTPKSGSHPRKPQPPSQPLGGVAAAFAAPFIPAPPSLPVRMKSLGCGGLASLVQVLDLSGWNLGDTCAQHIAAAVASSTSLRALILDSNGITDAGMDSIMAVLRLNKGLAKLSLLGNPIGSSGVQSIAYGALEMEQLASLHFGRNPIRRSQSHRSFAGPGGSGTTGPLSERAVDAFSRLMSASQLQSLHYEGLGNDFSPPSLQAVFESLERATANVALANKVEQWLEHGNIAAKEPHSRGIPAAPGTTSHGIRDLHLSNCFTCTSGSELSPSDLSTFAPLNRAMASPRCGLRTLSLHSFLGDSGALALSRGLGRSCRLTALHVSGCGIGVVGMHAIGEALRFNNALVVLDVSHQSPPEWAGAREAVASTLPMLRSKGGSCPRDEAAASGRGSRSGSDAPLEAPMRSTQKSSADLHESRSTKVDPSTSGKPLATIISALHVNRSLRELRMDGLDVGHAEIEDICAAIEQSNNRVISAIVMAPIDSDALALKLQHLLLENINGLPSPPLSMYSGTRTDSLSASLEHASSGRFVSPVGAAVPMAPSSVMEPQAGTSGTCSGPQSSCSASHSPLRTTPLDFGTLPLIKRPTGPAHV